MYFLIFESHKTSLPKKLRDPPKKTITQQITIPKKKTKSNHRKTTPTNPTKKNRPPHMIHGLLSPNLEVGGHLIRLNDLLVTFFSHLQKIRLGHGDLAERYICLSLRRHLCNATTLGRGSLIGIGAQRMDVGRQTSGFPVFTGNDFEPSLGGFFSQTKKT